MKRSSVHEQKFKKNQDPLKTREKAGFCIEKTHKQHSCKKGLVRKLYLVAKEEKRRTKSLTKYAHGVLLEKKEH